MKKRIEDYWQELQSQWLSHAFPFNQDTFQKIVTDILENHYTSAEAIVKHIGGGSGIESPEFTRMMKERFQRQLYREDALEFIDGYSKLSMLLQMGFILAVEGPYATEEIVRQASFSLSPDHIKFLRENMNLTASLIKQDPSGRTMMMRFADTMTRTSKRTYFNEGIMTAHDTFMAYSKCWEEYTKRNVQ